MTNGRIRGLRRARLGSLCGRLMWHVRRAMHVSKGSEIIGRPSDAIESYRKIVDLASAQAKIGLWECDLATSALAWSDGVYALFELPPNSRVTRAEAVTFYHPDSRAQMEMLRARALSDRTCFTLDARIRTAKGNHRWMRLTGNVECENGIPVRLFGMKQDITEEKDLLDRMRVLAETDLLTGLANRGAFQARLEAATGSTGALVLIDLDGFKQINDTYGHSAGDECLKQVATRLRAICPEGALIARLGGDEFAIVLPMDLARDMVEPLIALLLVDLRRPARWNGRQLSMSASIGVALPVPSPICDAALLFNEADLALYAAKADGRDRSRVFVPELRTKADARLRAKASALGADRQFELFQAPATDHAKAA